MSKYKVMIFSIFSFLNLLSMEEKESSIENYGAETILDCLDKDISIKGVQQIILSYLDYLPYKKKNIFLDPCEVCSVAFSPDNKFFAYVAYSVVVYQDSEQQYVISLMDLESNKEIGTVSVKANVLFRPNLSFTSDNKIILYQDNDKYSAGFAWCIVWNFGSKPHNSVVNTDFSKFRDQVFKNDYCPKKFYSPDKTYLAKIIYPIGRYLPFQNNTEIQIFKLGSSYKLKTPPPINSKCVIL